MAAPGKEISAGAASGAAAGAAIGTAVPIIGNVVGGAVGSVVGVIVGGIKHLAGGVSQDRFIDRTEQVYSILKSAGYSGGGHPGYQQYEIGKSQVPDKKKEGNYAPEFSRLREYIIDRVNFYNPGLGTFWGENFPMEMANLGNITGSSISELKKLVQAYPPGAYGNSKEFSFLSPPPSQLTTAQKKAVSQSGTVGGGCAGVAALLIIFGSLLTGFIWVAF